MVVVENAAQLAKFVGQASTLTSVKAIVMYRGDVPEGTDCGFPVYTWDQFMEVRFCPPETCCSSTAVFRRWSRRMVAAVGSRCAVVSEPVLMGWSLDIGGSCCCARVVERTGDMLALPFAYAARDVALSAHPASHYGV